MMKNSKNNSIINKMRQILQGTISLVLFILIYFMMHYVSDIQGTARVINYAGLVRGATQRMIMLEIVGEKSDERIAELDHYIEGIKDGDESLQLIHITDKDYQNKVTELYAEWKILKEEIYRVRIDGYQNTNIVALSKEYFTLSDEMVDCAEKYSQKLASNIKYIEIGINLVILFLVGVMTLESIKAVHVMRTNKELKERVYTDVRTGLPNKSACEQLLEDSRILTENTCCIMLDLNNLKIINDTYGHDAGDRLISNFSKYIRKNVPKDYFVGRYGGDEFIAILNNYPDELIDKVLIDIRNGIKRYNDSGVGIPINYAVGYAKSSDYDVCTMRTLLVRSDKNMYINKKETKKEAAKL